jgi:hypothetical protein
MLDIEEPCCCCSKHARHDHHTVHDLSLSSCFPCATLTHKHGFLKWRDAGSQMNGKTTFGSVMNLFHRA